MLIVNVETLDTIRGYLEAINRADIRDIQWMQGNVPILIEPGAAEDFKFTGLSNTDFYYAANLQKAVEVKP